MWKVQDAKGKSTQFDGQFRIENGRLTLVRSKDMQQMAGTWTAKDGGFNFKLDGANNAGLGFKKA